MSRFLTNAALAVWLGVSSPIMADVLPAAVTPPFPKISHVTPDIPADAEVPFTHLKPVAAHLSAPPAPIADIVARQANISNFGTACDPSISMDVAIDAMLAIHLQAPCLPYDMVRMEHEGLSFTVPMPMTGELHLLLPALSENAVVRADLSDGTVLSASADVPEAVEFARVALQWKGAAPGELVAKAPKVLDGAVIRLGRSEDADGSELHVFSSRIDARHATGVVRLSLLSPVTAENCETGREARVRRKVPGEPISAYDLKLKGPGCNAVGQSIELKNILQDLKLSQN